MKKCVCCEKEFGKEEKKLYYELGSVDLIDDVLCKECGKIIKVKNWLSAQFQSTKGVLKKYRRLMPEEGVRIDLRLNALRERKIKARKELIEEFAKEAEIRSKRSGCKERQQDKYTCSNCKNSWYVSDMDHIKNLYNATKGNFYSLNQLKEVGRCPKCGSSASTHKTVKYWVDKNGNCVDIEE